MARPGLAKKGQAIMLLTNRYQVSLQTVDSHFYHYYVNLKYEDDRPVDSKGIGRRVIDKLKQTYDSELASKDFAYGGLLSVRKSLVGMIAQEKLRPKVADAPTR